MILLAFSILPFVSKEPFQNMDTKTVPSVVTQETLHMGGKELHTPACYCFIVFSFRRRLITLL